MRDPERIHRVCGLLELVWGMYPDERLGQLITNLNNTRTDLFYVEDDLWEQVLVKCINSNGKVRGEATKEATQELLLREGLNNVVRDIMKKFSK